jgi:hypothetical protein
MKRFFKLGYWLAAVTPLSFLLPDGRRLAHRVQCCTVQYMQGDVTVAVAGARIRMYVKCCVIQPTPKL